LADQKSGWIVRRWRDTSRKARRAALAKAKCAARGCISQSSNSARRGATASGVAFPLPNEWRAKHVRGLQPSALRSRTALCGTLATLSAFAAASMFGASPAAANPEGGQVVAGAAEIIQTTPNRLDIIQSSSQAIIDWQSFSIGLSVSCSLISVPRNS